MCENRQSGFDMASNSSRLQWGTVPHQDPTKSSAIFLVVAGRVASDPSRDAAVVALPPSGAGLRWSSVGPRLSAEPPHASAAATRAADDTCWPCQAPATSR